MKKKAGFLLLAVCLTGLGGIFSLSAMDNQTFLANISFETDLNRLCRQVQGASAEEIRNLIREEKIYLLTARVFSRTNLTQAGESFSGELGLIDGEWQGVEEVSVFKAIVGFSGERFDGMIPLRRSRTPPPREIAINAQVLIAAKLSGVREVSGERIPLLEGIEIRALK